jgi:hypothetical protein
VGSGGGLSLTDSGLYTATNVISFALPNGILGSDFFAYAGSYGDGWPNGQSMSAVGKLPSASCTYPATARVLSNFGIELGGTRTNTASTITFSRLLVEYLPR